MRNTLCACACTVGVKVHLPPDLKMASANLSFTRDGLIYRPQHFDDDDEEDFLTEQKDGGTREGLVAASLCEIPR